MSEDVFRIVVTAAVVVASLAFVVQAAILYALYRVSRKTQESADRIKVHVEPMLLVVGDRRGQRMFRAAADARAPSHA